MLAHKPDLGPAQAQASQTAGLPLCAHSCTSAALPCQRCAGGWDVAIIKLAAPSTKTPVALAPYTREQRWSVPRWRCWSSALTRWFPALLHPP